MERIRILNKVIYRLKQKSFSCYRYGGHVFFPNGDIKKQSSYVSLDDIDLHLLNDLCNDLDGLRKDVDENENVPGQWDVNWTLKKEQRDREEWEKHIALLKEVAIVEKYVKGIGSIPVTAPVNEGFERYAAGWGGWSNLHSTDEECEKLQKFLNCSRERMMEKISLSVSKREKISTL